MKLKTLFAAVVLAVSPIAFAGELYVTNNGVTEKVTYTEKAVVDDGAACTDFISLKLLYQDMSNAQHFVGTGRCMVTTKGNVYKVIDGTSRDGVVNIYSHKQFLVVPAYVFGK